MYDNQCASALVSGYKVYVGSYETVMDNRKPGDQKPIQVTEKSGLEVTTQVARPGQAVMMATPMSADVDELVGTIVGQRYEIIAEIAHGGMGAVYKAKHLHMSKFVAIKVLRDEQLASTGLKRFELEAQAASSLNHPNLTVVHDFGFTDKKHPYLVMDFVDGPTLDSVIRQNGPLSPEQALPIFKQICEGLAYAHAKGIVHRDLKPSNVILADTESGGVAGRTATVRIVDFGIAKLTEQEGQNLTQTGEICGSPYYMSPEQSLGQKIDGRSDIYSLGCLMYESLCGVVPLKGDNAMQTLMKHLHDDPKPFSEVNPNLHVSRRVEAVVFKAMSKNVADRQQSAAELLRELQQISAAAEQRISDIIKLRPTTLRKSPRAFIVFALGFLLFGMMALFYNTTGQYVLVKMILRIPPMDAATEQNVSGILHASGLANMYNLHPACVALLDAARFREAKIGDPIRLGEIQLQLADTYRGWGDRTAGAIYQQAYAKLIAAGEQEYARAIDPRLLEPNQVQAHADRAERAFRDALKAATKLFPTGDVHRVHVMGRLAQSLVIQKDFGEALALAQNALSEIKDKPGVDHKRAELRQIIAQCSRGLE